MLIFQLLFFARHPFAGRPASGESPEIPQAIRNFQFAWAGDRGLLQPPKTLSLVNVGFKVEAYFRRAFGPQGESEGRPTARSWARALEELRSALRNCTANAAHQHLGQTCPLCAIELKTGGELFATPLTVSATLYNPEREANALWAAIEKELPPANRSAAPIPDNFLAKVIAVPYSPQPRRGWIGGVLEGLRLVEPLDNGERKARSMRLAGAGRTYDKLTAQWQSHDPAQAFNKRRTDLAVAKRELDDLFKRRGLAVSALLQSAGLHRFLDAFVVAQAGVKGIGRARVATL